MKYKIGQKVVYIGPDFRWHPVIVLVSLNCPLPGKVYTIRGGRPDLCGTADIPAANGYLLEEVVNAPRWCPIQRETIETHIDEDWLRPLQERKNDGEAFVAGLRPLLDANNLRVRERVR